MRNPSEIPVFFLRLLFRDDTAKILALMGQEVTASSGPYMQPFLLHHNPTFSYPCMFYAAFYFIWPNDVVMEGRGVFVRFNLPSRDSF